MAKVYIPEDGDKFKLYLKAQAYSGEVFVCTGRCWRKNAKGMLVEARREGSDEADFGFDRHIFVFEKV